MTEVTGSIVAPTVTASPLCASKCAITDESSRCGTIAISTGNGWLTTGVAPSAKCTLTTDELLPADTAATISGGRPSVLGAFGLLDAPGVAPASDGESPHAASITAATTETNRNP